MPRAVLVHNAFTTTGPSASSVLLDPGQDVSIYEPDGTTPLATAVYDVPSGGVPLLQPFSADNLGMLILYTAVAQSVVVTVNGIAYPSGFYPPPSTIEAGATGYSVVVDPVIGTTTTGNHGISGPIPHVDVRTRGARVGGNTATNRAAIQAAIDAVTAYGAGEVYIPETYHISGQPIRFSSSNVSLSLRGNGALNSGIVQDTPGVDVLSLGRTATVADPGAYVSWVRAMGLTLGGGRYSLRLNNVLGSYFHDLLLNNGTTGLYMEGQIEGNSFHKVNVEYHTSYGILGAANNGGTVGVVVGAGPGGTDLDVGNYPEFQKLDFSFLRVAGCLGPSAVKLTAGVDSGGSTHLRSGFSTFHHVILEDNKHDGIDLSYLDALTLDRINNEETGNLAATNTYTVIREGSGCGRVTLTNSALSGRQDDRARSYKYVIEQTDGILTAIGNVLANTADAGTANVLVNGIGATLIDNMVGDASTVSFTGAPVGTIRNSVLINNKNTSGVPDSGLPILAPLLNAKHMLAAHGQMLPNSGIDLGPTCFGTAVLCDYNRGAIAIVTLRGPGHVSDKVSDTANMVGTTLPVVPETWFLGWNGSTYYLQNNHAAPAGHQYALRLTDLS